MKTWRKKQEEREAMKSEDTVKETEKERGDLAFANPLAILRPPELETHNLFRSNSPFPSTNSAILSIFLKIKNPNHWVLFPTAQPSPIYRQEKPHWKHQAVGSKALIPTRLKGKKKKKIKNFHCPCIHSLQSENVFQFLYRLVFSLLFSLCINYDQFFYNLVGLFIYLFKFLVYIFD